MFTKREIEERRATLPTPIHRIALSNPVVHAIVDCYVVGLIYMREEALIQMIVALSDSHDSHTDIICQLMQQSAIIPSVLIKKTNEHEIGISE